VRLIDAAERMLAIALVETDRDIKQAQSLLKQYVPESLIYPPPRSLDLMRTILGE
jgi:hypothetical protein